MNVFDRAKPWLPDFARLNAALRLVWRSAPGLTLGNCAILLIQGPLPVIALYVLKLVIDTVSDGMAGQPADDAMRQVGLLLVLLAVLKLLEHLLNAVLKLVQEALTQVVMDDVHDLLHAQSVAVDLAYYENSDYYDTLHQAQEEAAFRPVSIVSSLMQLGRNAVSLLAALGLIGTLHWAAVPALLLAMLPQWRSRLTQAQGRYQWQRQHTAAQRVSWYFHWMLTSREHAKEVRAFELGDLFRQRFRDAQQRLRRAKLRLAAGHALRETAAHGLTLLVMFGVYGLLLVRTLHGHLTLGDLVMYSQAFQRGQAFLQSVLRNLAQLYEDTLFLAHLQEFLALPTALEQSPAPRSFPSPLRTGIVFDDVGFRYPHASADVLRHLSFEIRPGENIALVGENGAGKTTLIKLLCRFYDPTSGTILVDGVRLPEYDIASLRRNLSLIFQDYARYDLSVRENIGLGRADLLKPSAAADDLIREAARKAGADALITRLTAGYATQLGKRFADGAELSEGQWQKIALARAFLRDAQILVLDEPTSAMDARAEYDLFTAFRRMTQDRTAILISHRFSTVRMADRILVLAGGTIAESGSHEQLLRLGGTYAAMFEMQSRHYR